jgi:tetratricopeptide (TPR) repeat protein
MSELVVLVLTDPEQDTEEALGEARAAIAELEPLEDPTSLARAWHAVSEVGALRSDFELLEEAARRRLELARRTGLPRDVLWAAYWLTLALAHGPMPLEEAITRAEEALTDIPKDRVYALNLALLYAYAGRHEEAEETIGSARQTMLELGQRSQVAINVGWISLLAGHLEQAESELRTAAEQLEAAGWSEFLSTVAATLAEVLYRLGRDEEAEGWTRRSERATMPEQVMSQAQWRSTRAKVLARSGETEEALRLAAEGVEWAYRSDGLPLLGDTLFARGEVLLLLGRPDEARPVLEEALAVYERKGVIPSIERTRTLLADIPS